jgi:hypothetical protein
MPRHLRGALTTPSNSSHDDAAEQMQGPEAAARQSRMPLSHATLIGRSVSIKRAHDLCAYRDPRDIFPTERMRQMKWQLMTGKNMHIC